jgi:hypothetical protein
MLGSEKVAGDGKRLAGSSLPFGEPLATRSSASKKLIARLQTSSSVSMPNFLTFGVQILLGIQAGAFLGLFTCNRSPVNMCTFLVPRSRSLIFFCGPGWLPSKRPGEAICL